MGQIHIFFQDFWEIVEGNFCAVDPTIKVLLSANGFRNYYAFKGIEVDDILIENLAARIKSLGKDSDYYKSIMELTQEQPEDFVMCLGFKTNIINLFKVINEQPNFPIKSEMNDQKKRAAKRDASHIEEPSTSNKSLKHAKIITSIEDHEKKIRGKVEGLIKACNPSIDEENINFGLEHLKTTENSVVFTTHCFLCKTPLQISAVTMNNNYIQYRIDNYTKHVLRKHKEAAKNLMDLKASTLFNYFHHSCILIKIENFQKLVLS